MDDHIELARQGAILTLRLARPDKKNALTASMYTARALAEKPPAALRRTKRLIRCDQEALEAAITREFVDFGECVNFPEAREAFSAFLEKRKPDFAQGLRPATPVQGAEKNAP